MDCIVHSLLKKLSAQYRQAQPIFSYLRHFMESNINIDFACGKILTQTAPIFHWMKSCRQLHLPHRWR